MRQRRPHGLVPNVGARDRVEYVAVQEPLNPLGAPVGRVGAVNLDCPAVPPVVGQGRLGSAADGLVARPAAHPATVQRAVGLGRAVDRLHDVDLAALGPGGAVAHAVAEEPKGGPHAFLVGLVVVAEAEDGLDGRDLAGLGGEGVL